ncbi:MAG TPA: hypothetical protein VGL89_08125 [Candidatus Koribacter sp.]|jgi:hypothetical protein
MIKKAALALFSLMFGVALLTPAKANAAEVVVGVAPRPYMYVAPGPVVVAPRYYRPYRPYAYYRGYYGPRYAYRYHPYRNYWRR